MNSGLHESVVKEGLEGDEGFGGRSDNFLGRGG